MLRAELIYAAVAEDADVETGFGDFRVRVRVPLLRNPGWTVSLVGGGRMGAGKVSLFPYSTSSIDVEGGLAAIDTLRSVALWAMTTGTIVTRVAEVLDRDDGHQNYLTAAGGAAWDPKGWFSVNGGAVAYFLRGGATRSEVFLSPEAVTGGGISVFVTTVIETGADEDRAVDVAVSLGLHARY